MSAKRKVLLVTRNLEFGGVERRVALIAEFLDRERYEPAVACLRNTGPYAERLRSLGVPVYDLSVRSQLNPAVVGKLKKLIRSEGFEIVDCHQTRANIWGTRAARAAGARAILASNYLIKNWRNPLLRRLEIGGFRIAQRIVTDSLQLADEISRRGGIPRNKLVTIPNGVPDPVVDQQEVERLRREFGLTGDEVVFGMVGRLVPYKGQMLLLRAFSLVADRLPRVRVFCIGKEGESGYLQKLWDFVDARDLRSRVVITEYDGNILFFMSLFDVFVLPSSGESLPISILESLSLGKPVIATRIGGVENAVRDGENGFLIPENGEKELSERMEQLARDDGLRRRFAERSQELYREEYRLENMIRRIEELYETVYRERS